MIVSICFNILKPQNHGTLINLWVSHDFVFDLYFWWPVTCKQLLYNLRVNILTSVVNIQVSRVTPQKYLTIYITLLFAGCLSVCLVAQNQKKMAKICFINGIVYWFEECTVFEWCMLHNTFHLTFLTMQKFQLFKLIREPYLLELKIVFLKEQFHKITQNLKHMFFISD